MTIRLGKTARHLRESLGLTQRAAAERLGISFVHLCNIENNRASPSAALIDKFRNLWGVDLYVLAWCLHGDGTKLPPDVQGPTEKLAAAWRKYIQKLIQAHRDVVD